MQHWEWILTFILIGPLIITIIVLGFSLIGVGIKDLTRYLDQLWAEEEPLLPDDTIPNVDKYIEELKRQRGEG